MLQSAQPLSGNQRPDLTSHHLWWTCLLCCACHARCIFADPLQMSHACHHFRKCYKTLTFCPLLTLCIIPCACNAKRHLNVQKCSEPVSFLHFWLPNVLRATTACTFSKSQLPKVFRASCVLYILTSKCASRHTGVHFSSSQLPKVFWKRQFFTFFPSKCASRHNGVHFFNISTSKSAPNLVCFAHFDFEMCFAPQRGAIFLSSGQVAPHPPL